MKVLAIDTSNRPLSIAVLDDEKVLATTTITTQRKHAAYAMQIVEKLMKLAKLQPEDLDRIVIADGPGSYTGLRVAVTIGKVLADTLQIELVTVSSLLTLALNVQTNEQLVMPLFDARNDILFTGLYRTSVNGPVEVLPDQHVAFEDFVQQVNQFDEPIIFLGEDVDKYAERLQTVFGSRFKTMAGIDNLPQAAKLGIYGEQQAPVAEIDRIVPKYLRLTQAEADWQKLHPGEGHESYVEQV
ncbi:tRNA (adenosine(37)-N6)-threonylcarbamoyltransferase complex dimerization subunit type 1 TsaB [Fructilactobacillus frigidiflavus]|uniref:tRNA (adenosine(37)-N6)-threonylcarbamoyltransferase complex dimerization subunit type 1 TsaB n=1 Tax=Fructilactobacillus frigidiflavus TaxID=3242688 RepID=UPI0037584309